MLSNMSIDNLDSSSHQISVFTISPGNGVMIKESALCRNQIVLRVHKKAK